MWKWEDLTPFGQGIIAGIAIGMMVLIVLS